MCLVGSVGWGLWLLLADADGVRVSGLALVPDLCTVAVRSADTFFFPPSCLHTNSQHTTTNVLTPHPTASEDIAGIWEEFPRILSTKQTIGFTNNHKK